MISHDLNSGVEDADVIFPRTWVSPNFYIHTREEESRIASQYKDWRLTEDLLKRTNDARFIHDGPNSLVYDQAENLLHVRKAFLASVLAEVSVLDKI